MVNCQYAIKCPQCYLSDGFENCARHKLAEVIGIDNVPHWLGVIGYGHLPELIKAHVNKENAIKFFR